MTEDEISASIVRLGCPLILVFPGVVAPPVITKSIKLDVLKVSVDIFTVGIQQEHINCSRLIRQIRKPRDVVHISDGTLTVPENATSQPYSIEVEGGTKNALSP